VGIPDQPDTAQVVLPTQYRIFDRYRRFGRYGGES
jgi:hypothetical protein